MLRTALGPAISAYLEDPGIVEVMLNPDGRLWIDRLSGGLASTLNASASSKAVSLKIPPTLLARPADAIERANQKDEATAAPPRA